MRRSWALVVCLVAGLCPILSSSRHNRQFEDEALRCYSCVYIENSPVWSHEGCEREHPPEEFSRKDCYGFGSLQVAGGFRHSEDSSEREHDRQLEPLQTYCVKITGFSDTGNRVIFRGCDALPADHEFTDDRYCVDHPDFPFPGQGHIRNVQECYCSGDNCNRSTAISTGYLPYFMLSAILTLHFGFAAK